MANENKVSNFTPDILESKFLAETNTDEIKDVDSMFPKPAAVSFEKQQVPTFKSNDDFSGNLPDNVPPFIIKKIELHRLSKRETPESAIIKTLDKGRKL